MNEELKSFKELLLDEEKSAATVEKYMRDVRTFCESVPEPTKEAVIAYKSSLCARYKPSGVNSRLVAINRYLRFIGRSDCCVRLLRIQRQMFVREDKELTAKEYKRLVRCAGDSRIGYILQTICGTGIRVSELEYITVEAVSCGRAEVNCKGKLRVIFISEQVQRTLKKYIKKSGVNSGPVFVTRTGKPLNRSNIWREMKSLCQVACVEPSKVFPHNLRHLFARTFYQMKKDIVRLADLLGHSSVETTRIYTVETGCRHREDLNAVGRLLLTT